MVGHGTLAPLAGDRTARHRGAGRARASSPPTTPRPVGPMPRPSTRRSSPLSASVNESPTTMSPRSSTSCRRRSVPPAGSWIHYGLTSTDVVDTALCWAMRDAGRLLVSAIDPLIDTVVALARRHRTTVMIGRTHGIHAEPTTFGAKAALWALQLDRDRAGCARPPRPWRSASCPVPWGPTPTSIRPSSVTSATRSVCVRCRQPR